MAIAEIHNWLNGSRDFEAGRSIYFRIGTNALVKDQLRMKETSYLRRKLLDALVEMNEDARTRLRLTVTANQSRTMEPERMKVVNDVRKMDRPKIVFDELPTLLKNRWLHKAKCWAKMNSLIYELRIGEVERNVKLIKSIKKLDAEIDGIWKELDYYHHTCEFLKNEDENDKPKHELQRDLLNARTYVSKYKDVKGKESLYKKHFNTMLRLTELLDGSI